MGLTKQQLALYWVSIYQNAIFHVMITLMLKRTENDTLITAQVHPQLPQVTHTIELWNVMLTSSIELITK